MKTLFLTFIALSVVGFLAPGCSTARRGPPITAPVDVSAPGVRNGQDSYRKNCYQCHGAGEGGLGPAINDKPLPAFMIRLQVRNGVGAMPAFDETEIPQQELANLADYLQRLRRSG